MAITKEIIADKIEVLETGIVQVRTATVIKEDGTELTRTFHRSMFEPSTRSGDNWVDTDVSGEPSNVQAICAAVWTDAIKTAFEEDFDANIPEIPPE